MRKSDLVATLLLGLLLALPVRGQSSMPLLTAVDPASGSPGDVLTVTGDHLDSASVAALYLTDGKHDVTLEITEQTATWIKFRIPVQVPAGRFVLMVLTQGKDAKLIEEPVKVQVEPLTKSTS